MAAILGRELLALNDDPTPARAAQAQAFARGVKGLADAARSVVALAAAAAKGAPARRAASPSDATPDASSEMDMDDAPLDTADYDRARVRLERRIAQIMGSDAGKPPAAGLRGARHGAGAPPVGGELPRRAAPA